MKITTIQYHKVYNLGNYCSEKIGLEASIDETEQSLHDAAKELKEYCDEIHKQNNPHLFQETQVMDYSNPPSTFTNNTGTDTLSMKYAPIEEPKISPEQEIEEVLAGIEAATNETELTQWVFPASKNIKTAGAYSRRKKQLGIIE